MCKFEQLLIVVCHYLKLRLLNFCGNLSAEMPEINYKPLQNCNRTRIKSNCLQILTHITTCQCVTSLFFLTVHQALNFVRI
jgi:hypothetical protein